MFYLFMYLKRLGIDIDAGCGQLKADLIRKQKLLQQENIISTDQ